MIYERRYHIHEVSDYINWLYFFHAWSLPVSMAAIVDVHQCPACKEEWVERFPEDRRQQASDAVQLYTDALAQLREWDKAGLQTHFRLNLQPAYSDGDDIILPELGERLPMLRQQTGQGPYLSLADFVSPERDTIGLFASTADSRMEATHPDDAYRHMLSQTLADRLAEATAEAGHEYTRHIWWGYASRECLPVRQLLECHYQGIRPAVGYPCLPDQSLNFQLGRLLDFKSMGIQLTEHAAMLPHASTTGLMIAHPQARYFTVGPIGEDQLAAYARRRGIAEEEVRTFLGM